MNRRVAPVVALIFLAGQTGVASATAKDSLVLGKVSAPSCATPGKSTKVVRAARRVNRCDTDDHKVHLDSVPFVFAGSAVAGVIAIGLGTKNDNPASP